MLVRYGDKSVCNKISVRELKNRKKYMMIMVIKCVKKLKSGDIPVQGYRRLRFRKFLDSRHMKVTRFLALRAGRLYVPG